MRRRICVVTGSRAEYGLLKWVIRDLVALADVDALVVVTGTHLSPEFGFTASEIESDGISVAARIEMLLSSDSAVGVAKSMALGLAGLADAYFSLRPDIVVVLGDRFEILAAASAALVLGIPIAHIAGGDLTEGAIDDSFRHAITKMAHLHFTTNSASARRVAQLGEEGHRIHNVGSPGIDAIQRLVLLEKEELEGYLGITFESKNLLVTFHPETIEPEQTLSHFEALMCALARLPEGYALFITRPNADVGGRSLSRRIDAFVAARPHAYAFASLGQLKYLSLMKSCDAVVGNSSSGLYEAPALRKPTVNIGDRQKGRLAAESVLTVPADSDEIARAIARALASDCSKVVSPYGDGRSSERIVRILTGIADYRELLRKRFSDL